MRSAQQKANCAVCGHLVLLFFFCLRCLIYRADRHSQGRFFSCGNVALFFFSNVVYVAHKGVY